MIDTDSYAPSWAEQRAEVTPGRRAFAAILLQAVVDLQKPPTNPKRQKNYIEAHLWIASNRMDYETAFLRVCEVLNTDFVRIRKKFNICPNDSFFGWKHIATREPQATAYPLQASGLKKYS